jgi:hypothetical protein
MRLRKKPSLNCSKTFSSTMGVDQAFQFDNPWLKMGPFRGYEEPGTGCLSPEKAGTRPVYYADFMDIAGRPFFNCVTEIRDIAGYEWKPDNNIVETTQRGVQELRRALDSMALAVLFTHETDHLSKIQPDHLEKELFGVASGISNYQPQHVTQDDGFKYVRATHTSRIESAVYDPHKRMMDIRFTGYADVPTSFQVYSDTHAEIRSEIVPVPAFKNHVQVTHILR